MKSITAMPSTLPTNPSAETASDPQEQIRRRAYELYEQRGRADGNELRDWVEAELEVLKQWSNKLAA